ncbi:MAG: hypothetical protein JW742_04935 [Candidatus Aminicenantes bacterium]|nr:hypothetical protein [Candidatus Aminicenantes bacterium]
MKRIQDGRKPLRAVRTALIVLCFWPGPGFADQGLALRGAYGDLSCLGIQAGRAYIFTGERFHVFDLEDGTPLKTFGGVGQGPAEWGSYFAFPFLTPYGIAVSNKGKCVFFDLDGTHLKSIQPGLLFDKVLRFGSRFVGLASNLDPDAGTRTAAVQILDDELGLVREIYREKKGSRWLGKDGRLQITLPGTHVDFTVRDGKIYVGDSAEAVSISVFSGGGDLIRGLERKAAKVKIPDEAREKYAPAKKAISGAAAAAITVSKYYPAFHFFKVEAGLIYVFTYNIKDGRREVLVLDENGGSAGSVWLTEAAAMSSCIYEKRFYYVVNDEESGEVMLHAEAIF